VTTQVISITLSEWETKGPDNCAELKCRFLEDSRNDRQVADLLTKSQMLVLSELRHGLQVTSRSHIGRVRIGDLSVTILPKIKGTSLLSLIRYAYGFRKLKLISEPAQLVDQYGIEDLLVCQLNTEVQELISRGLLRAYIPTSERLSSPRGRINVSRIALDGGIATATLPCHYYPRVEDTLFNQVLMSGLKLAGSIASVVDLQRESRRLASLMEEQVSTVRLDGMLLNRACRQMNRLTGAYSSSLSIIRLLMEAQGVVLEGQAASTKLPGFLFDMNAFFQALISRFLQENLPSYSVCDEHALKGMMRYNPKFNPRRRQSPTPRPDYVVFQQKSICSILDAKYRDLWTKDLPREMLYQLVVYAVSQSDCRQSSILYPTNDVLAKEARIDVSDPVFGSHLGRVCLRPVHLPLLEKLVTSSSAQVCRDRAEFAIKLAFGETP